ncbi:uncharacterized protein LOC129568968 isoform X2 [Sitodiplosis mosellana]|uniref:uncharacterized protein LOC129568968 isoform X2 n=1 Tax=Sitodiplosis mosellana TaxID=263140 RepID=UPI002443A77E|nr:uncharacterized protein LOC129568968 isoform X2 [Sitodiplosis mosellana]
MRYLTTLVVALCILLSFADGAPSMARQRHRRHYWPANDQFHPNKIIWNNSCGGTVPKNDTFSDHRNRTAKPLKGLRNELPNYLVRLNDQRAQAIDTDDVSQWFSEPFNATYKFLAQINASTSNIHLRKRHIETQVYVGAFQYLRYKQLHHDTIRNVNINKTKTLEYLLILAKNLLCEIETAINNTGMKMPVILSRAMMDNRLTFRNNGRRIRKPTSDYVDEVDEIDSKFAKVRFSEYLQGLEQVLKNRMGKQHHHIKKKPRPTRKLKKNLKQNAVVGAVRTKVNKPSIDNVHHLHENHIDGSVASMKRHRSQKHRNLFGPQQARSQKQLRKGIASLRPNEINMFRNHRKNVSAVKSAAAAEPMVASKTSTTTTVAPQI